MASPPSGSRRAAAVLPANGGPTGDVMSTGERPVIENIPVVTPPVLVNASLADEGEGAACIEFHGHSYTVGQAAKIARDFNRACGMAEPTRTLRGFDK